MCFLIITFETIADPKQTLATSSIICEQTPHREFLVTLQPITPRRPLSQQMIQNELFIYFTINLASCASCCLTFLTPFALIARRVKVCVQNHNNANGLERALKVMLWLAQRQNKYCIKLMESTSKTAQGTKHFRGSWRATNLGDCKSTNTCWFPSREFCSMANPWIFRKWPWSFETICIGE